MPKGQEGRDGPRRIGVLLFDRFSNHCLANAVEPLRVCNSALGRRAYEWQFLTLDGGAVRSSSGLPVAADAALGRAPGGQALFVLPSYGFRRMGGPVTARALRAAAGRFDVLAGMDAGSWLLAEAGLLDGRRATIHWEELDAFAERFPEVTVLRRRLVRDGPRWSCAGAATAFDLVLDMIREDHGALMALEVAAFLMHGAAGAEGPARAPSLRAGAGGDDGLVMAAVAIMRETLEEPLPLAGLAVRLGVPLSTLKDHFARHVGQPPGQVYRALRLSAARRLVGASALPITEIALRTGYDSPAAMTRAFRRAYGLAPSALRAAAPGS